MPTRQRIGDIEIDEDKPFQELFWKVERAGWVAMTLLVLAALFGLLGSGPLSATTAYAGAAGSDEAPLKVEYHRFARRHAQTTLRIEVQTLERAATTPEIRIGRDYLQAVKIDSISPPPESVRPNGDALVYAFQPGSTDRVVVNFFVRPQLMGALGGRVATGDETVSIRQFVYP